MIMRTSMSTSMSKSNPPSMVFSIVAVFAAVLLHSNDVHGFPSVAHTCQKQQSVAGNCGHMSSTTSRRYLFFRNPLETDATPSSRDDDASSSLRASGLSASATAQQQQQQQQLASTSSPQQAQAWVIGQDVAMAPASHTHGMVDAAGTNDLDANAQNHEIPSIKSDVDMSLIQTIWNNQGAILLFSTAVAALCSIAHGQNPLDMVFGSHWHSAAFDPFQASTAWPGEASFVDPSPVDRLLSTLGQSLVQGAIAVVPMIFLEQAASNLGTRGVTHLDFSTTNSVINMFGRRRSPQSDTPSYGYTGDNSNNRSNDSTNSNEETTDTLTMGALSMSIATVSGISEEIVLRGYLMSALQAVTQSLPFAVVGQALAFGLGHVSPTSKHADENATMAGLQFANGLMYGLLYHLSGGNIMACIVAHILHDMHVLCEAWMTINDQMDYTQRMMALEQDHRHHAIPQSEQRKIQDIQSQAGLTSLSGETVDFAKRFFYAFDQDQKGSLSLDDAQRAISYAFYENADPTTSPSPEAVESTFRRIIDDRQASYDAYIPPNRLSVSEFLRLLFILKMGRD